VQLKKILFGLVSLLLLVVVLSVLFRNSLLHFAFEKARQKLKERYNVAMQASDLRFTSLNRIAVKELSIVPHLSDTLLQVESADTRFSIAKLLVGKIALYDINADSIALSIFNGENRNNIKHLKKSTAGKANKESSATLSYNQWLRKIEEYLQTTFSLRQVAVSYNNGTDEEKIFLPVVKFQKSSFYAIVTDEILLDSLNFSGVLDIKKQKFDVHISTSGNEDFALPLLDKIDSLKGGFKSIDIHSTWHENGYALTVNTSVVATRLHLQHWRLAAEKITLPLLKFDGRVTIASNSIQLDSVSTVQIANLPLQVFARYSAKDTFKQVALKVNMPEISADTFFNSLPQGMFNSLKGISCNGTLAYHLNFAVDTRVLDSLVFESEMKRKGLGLKHYGTENFACIENDFKHDVFVKGIHQRQLDVSRSNPFFTSLRQINPYLISSVLQAEDPSFMRHNGFLESAFKESIIQNIREKRFARGGSTITMQLVKNVFLNRDKNVARKAEEALIVYLIENLNLVSKERMLEVYLNIIEWGPNVYGIGEASHFYFNKKPAELSLQESIFLAGIIPRPRSFKYHIEKDGTLKPHFVNFFEILSNRMVLRGLVAPEATQHIFEPLKLKGAALQHVSPETWTPQDEDIVD
jgi:hypothetical protein